MEFIVGVALALFVCGAASMLGVDRDRVSYPTILMTRLFALTDRRRCGCSPSMRPCAQDR